LSFVSLSSILDFIFPCLPPSMISISGMVITFSSYVNVPSAVMSKASPVAYVESIFSNLVTVSIFLILAVGLRSLSPSPSKR
jgi:hypothetical protein